LRAEDQVADGTMHRLQRAASSSHSRGPGKAAEWGQAGGMGGCGPALLVSSGNRSNCADKAKIRARWCAD
jgi:hypothetical protein